MVPSVPTAQQLAILDSLAELQHLKHALCQSVHLVGRGGLRKGQQAGTLGPIGHEAIRKPVGQVARCHARQQLASSNGGLN